MSKCECDGGCGCFVVLLIIVLLGPCTSVDRLINKTVDIEKRLHQAEQRIGQCERDNRQLDRLRTPCQ